MEELEVIVQKMFAAGEPEENIKFFIEEYNAKKQNDPVQETASVGSENISSTDLNLENTSSELPKDPNREKLIQLETELAATMADPKTMNSDENFKKRKSLKKKIKALGGDRPIEEVELEGVVVEPKELDVNQKRIERFQQVTDDFLKNYNTEGKTWKELSQDPVLEKELKNEIKRRSNRIAFGEKLPQYYNKNAGRDMDDLTTMDGIFNKGLEKVLEKEKFENSQNEIKRINFLKKTNAYGPLVNLARNQFDYTDSPNKKKVNELGKRLLELRRIIEAGGDDDAINKAIVESNEIIPQYTEAWNSIQKRKPGEKTFFNPLTNQLEGERDEPQPGLEDVTNRYASILNSYENKHIESLENELVLRELDQQDFDLAGNQTVDITIDGKDGFQIALLQELGYEVQDVENTTFLDRLDILVGKKAGKVVKNVKYSDLVKLKNSRSSDNTTSVGGLNKIFDSTFMEGINGFDENGKAINIQEKVQDLYDDKIDLQLRKNALEEIFILNNDPASKKITMFGTPLAFVGSATKNIGASISGFFNREESERFIQSLPATKREKYDNYKEFLNDKSIPLSKDQQENFKRGFAFELFGEALPGFTGDLIKFGIANKVAGAAGITARIQKLTKTEPVKAFFANNLMEGVKFSAVMADPDMFGEGFYFGAGSQVAGKLLPKLTGSLAKYNTAYTKIVGGGAGMASGSEVAALTHAFVDQMMGDTAFQTGLDELYGEQSDAGRRITLNLGMGGALGGIKINPRAELSNMAARRNYAKEISDNINEGKYKGKELEKKEVLLAHLNRDIALVDAKFNELDLGSQQKLRNEAINIVERGEISGPDILTGNIIKRKATKAEIKEAKNTINRYELNKSNAKRLLNKYGGNVKKSGVFGETFKFEIKEGEGALLGEGNKAEYDPVTNTVRVDINKFRPGVFAQEIGHAMMKAAFGKNKKAATIFRDKIQETVNTKLKGETFNVGGKEGLTFEEAIKEAYKEKKNQQPEEYVMNVVEFLSQPKYQHLLLKNGVISDIKRTTLNIANRIGLDYSNKKNFTTGEQMLEFLFSIGKVAEGGSASAIKNKFKAFSNIVIDGNKIYNRRSGKEISKEDINRAASKNFSKEITPELTTPKRKSVLQAIKDLVPKNIKTKEEFDAWATSPRGGQKLGEAFVDGGAISNYIRSGKTRAESDKTLEDVLERTMKFNPEAKRADGTVVGIEGFGERIFADAAWARLTSKEALFKEGEKLKQERSIDQNDFQIADNVVKTRIEPTKKGGTPSIIQTNLKVNGKRITEKNTKLREDFLKEADAVLEKVADLGFKPGDKGFRKALAKTIKTNNPELFEAFKKELGDYNKLINENYNTVLTNKKAIELEFYVQAEKFTKEPMFVKKVKRATKQAEIREAIRKKKATYTENEAQGVNVYDRLNPPKAKGLEFFKIPNVKKRLFETLYKGNLVDAIINQSKTKEIYSTSEKAKIAEKFQKERDVFYSKELKAETEQGRAARLREELIGKEGTFKNAKEEREAYENLIDKIDDVKLLEKLNTFFQTANVVTYGNRYYTQQKTNGKYNGKLKINASKGSFMVSNSKNFTGPEAAKNKRLFEMGELFDVAVLQKRIADKLNKKVVESETTKWGKKETKAGANKTYKNIPSEIKNNFSKEKVTEKAIQEYIDAAVKLYEIAPRAAASLLYNQNASSGINRMLAKAIGYEIGTKPGNASRYEHVLQNGEFNLLLKDIATTKNPQSKKIMSDWLKSKDGYRQLVITKATEKIVDGTYSKDGVIWKAKERLHPDVKADWNRVKNGDTSIKIRSAESRLFNDFFIKENKIIDPNKLITGEGKTYAEKYGVNVPKKFLNEQVIKEQYKLIKEIILDGKSVASAKKAINAAINIYKQQNIAAKKISKNKTGIYEQAIKDGAAKNKAAKQEQIKTFNSKDISGEFNSYLEKSTGIKKEAVFGAATAMARGKKAKTDFGDYFIPVGAEDFAGLMHKTLARGKQGEKQLKFYEKTLYDPYNRAVEAMTNEAMAMKNDFKALKQELSNVPKTLKEYTDGGIFTKEQAVRVDIWNKLGYEIPGISNKVKAELLKTVKDNAELNTFANEIIKITKGDGYAKPKESWVAGNIAIDMVDLINGTKRTKHLEVWQNNVDQLFSKENLFKLEAAYGAKYVKTLKGTLERMKSGSNRKWGANETVEKWNDWVNGSVGAIMFLNTRSAVLQTISNINYLNFKDNNPLQAAKAFANQKQYWTDFNTLFNSQYLQSRRGGNRININESELALAQKKGGVQGVIALMLNKGFVLTRMADSFAIATGGASMYRNRLNTYKKQGLSEKEAKEKAFTDFMKITEETQQSSRPDRISEQQASSLGRFMLAFANTPMQYNRIIKRNLQDLTAGRGDAREKITKITYYGMIQNIIFNALQKALFISAFSDEEDDKQQERTVKVAEGMLDTLLRGSGLYGNAAVAVKNTAKAIATDKQDPELQALTISPPLYSKVSKLRSAFFTRKYITKQNMFEPSLDNPALNAGAQFSSAVFNFPLDRAIRKAQNIEAAVSDDANYMQRAALLLGWNDWELNMEQPEQNKGKSSTNQRKPRKRTQRRKIR